MKLLRALLLFSLVTVAVCVAVTWHWQLGAVRVPARAQQLTFAHDTPMTHVLRALVCDADPHSARPSELDDATAARLLQLDPNEAMRLVGIGTGHRGVASPRPVIAAAEHARATNRPTVAMALGDAFMRLALVVQPTGIALS